MAERFSETARVRDRFCKLMGWPPSESNMITVIRKLGEGEAICVSVEKADAIADRIEAVERECDEARKHVNELNDILRRIGYGQGEIDSFATVIEGVERERDELTEQVKRLRAENESMAKHEDTEVSAGVSHHTLDAIGHLDGFEYFQCYVCGIGFFLPSGRCDHCNAQRGG